MTRFVALALGLVALGACERGELLGRLSGPVGEGGGGGAAGEGGAEDPVGALSLPDVRDTDPTFTEDRLELYFMSTRGATKDVFKSTRPDAEAAWGEPVPATELNTPDFQDENPRISADGLRIWFFTDRDRSLGTIWESTRASITDEWGSPVPVAGLSVGVGSSNVSAGMNATATLAIVSSRPMGAPGYDLYAFERASTSEAFGTPTALVELNSASDDFDPYLTPDGLSVAFSSNRRGTYDVYLARRTSLDVPFEAPVALELNTTTYEEDAPNFSPDLAFLMYSSNVDGSADIRQAILFP